MIKKYQRFLSRVLDNIKLKTIDKRGRGVARMELDGFIQHVYWIFLIGV
jgi:hypothetical protein